MKVPASQFLVVFGVGLVATSCGVSDRQGTRDRVEHASQSEDAVQPALSPDASATRICDGRSTLRLAIRNGSCCGAVDHPLYSELGSSYLYVRGDCQYWAQDWSTDPAWALTRTGTLTADEETELAADLHYALLPSIAGDYPPGQLDSGQTVSTGAHTVECQYACDERLATAPAEVKSFSATFREWRKRLVAIGRPMMGPLRVVVKKFELESPAELDDCHPTWPFSLNPSSVETIAEDWPGVWEPSSKISDLGHAAEIRSWVNAYREDPRGCTPLSNESPAEFYSADRRIVYHLFVRESLPLENEAGEIELAPPL